MPPGHLYLTCQDVVMMATVELMEAKRRCRQHCDVIPVFLPVITGGVSTLSASSGSSVKVLVASTPKHPGLLTAQFP